MSEAITSDTGGQVRSDERLDNITLPDEDANAPFITLDTHTPNAHPTESLSPLPSASSHTQAMPVTVEDCEDEGERRSLAPTSAPSLASPSLALPIMDLPTIVSTPVISPTLTHASNSTSTTRSRSSGGSGKTVSRPPLTTDRIRRDSGRAPSPRKPRPMAMNYLTSDSPDVSPAAIHEAQWRYNQAPIQGSPAMRSPSSSNPSNHADVFTEPSPDNTSYGGWSPEQSMQGQSPTFTKLNGHPPVHHPQPQSFSMSYGHPDMSHGNPSIPQFPPGILSPRFQVPAQPPRAEPPPLSGYELVAAKLAGGIHGAPVKPLYRRFDALNHRILLHLQDEISELEDQLRELDAMDTHNRSYPGHIAPASHRQESISAGPPFTRKREILGAIGYKLTQYNKVISSFKKVKELPPPTMNDIQDYKAFFTASTAVEEPETRFLDTNDLVLLTNFPMQTSNPSHFRSDDALTPMPRAADDAGFPPARPMSASSAYSGTWQSYLPPGERVTPATLAQLALAMSVALLVPILTFAVIPGFVGRMTVVVLVGIGVSMAMLQSGMFKLLASNRGALDLVLYTGVYGGVMAVIAGTFG